MDDLEVIKESEGFAAAIQNLAEDEEAEPIYEVSDLEVSELDVLESPSPSPTPVIIVEDAVETFDTSVEDMQPLTLLIVFAIAIVVLLYILRGDWNADIY